MDAKTIGVIVVGILGACGGLFFATKKYQEHKAESKTPATPA